MPLVLPYAVDLVVMTENEEDFLHNLKDNKDNFPKSTVLITDPFMLMAGSLYKIRSKNTTVTKK